MRFILLSFFVSLSALAVELPEKLASDVMGAAGQAAFQLEKSGILENITQEKLSKATKRVLDFSAKSPALSASIHGTKWSNDSSAIVEMGSYVIGFFALSAAGPRGGDEFAGIPSVGGVSNVVKEKTQVASVASGLWAGSVLMSVGDSWIKKLSEKNGLKDAMTNEKKRKQMADEIASEINSSSKGVAGFFSRILVLDKNASDALAYAIKTEYQEKVKNKDYTSISIKKIFNDAQTKNKALKAVSDRDVAALESLVERAKKLDAKNIHLNSDDAYSYLLISTELMREYQDTSEGKANKALPIVIANNERVIESVKSWQAAHGASENRDSDAKEDGADTAK